MTSGVDPGFADAVAARVLEARQRIDAASGGRPVALVAVTKGFAADAVAAALAAGVDAVAENYAQELVAKQAALAELAIDGLPPDGRWWHFIGRLQRNKVRQLAPLVALYQSIDRAAVAAEVAKRAPGASVLIQVDISGEATKAGCAPAEVPALVEDCADRGLEVRGLMGVGATGTAEEARRGFAALVALADDLSLPERSIGMSNDFEVAVEEGSTMVRLGTVLFGARQYPGGSAG